MTSHSDVVDEVSTTLIDLGGIDPGEGLSWYRSMALIREFELRAEELVPQGKIFGGIHSARGQEAAAVGVISALRSDDVITGTHRSHHVTLAKGVPPNEMMAELFGKATGVVGGRGGHLHLADFDRGHYGSNAVVGGAVGMALGVAFAQVYQGHDRVAVGYVGDGGMNTGRVWEFANLAAIWDLPLIIVCENNMYAVETPAKASTAGPSSAARAESFGLQACTVDGQDVAAVNRASRTAVSRARAGEGPSFIEALTYRYSGHNVGERETYRTPHEVAEWQRDRDPIARLKSALVRADMATSESLQQFDAEAVQTVAAAIEFADSSPYPDPASAYTNVTCIDSKVRVNR